MPWVQYDKSASGRYPKEDEEYGILRFPEDRGECVKTES